MPQFGVFNYGNVMAQAEGIKSARLRNEAAGLNLEQMRRRERNRKKIEAMRAQSENAGQIVQQLRADGNFEAADDFIALQQKQHQATMSMMGSVADQITDQASYEKVRGYMLNEGLIRPEQLPPDYDKSIFKNIRKQAERKFKEFEFEVGVSPEGVTQERQMVLDQFGNVVHQGPVRGDVRERELMERRGARRQKGAEFQQKERRLRRGGEGTGGISATDSARIGRSVAAFYGGIFDPSSNSFSIPSEPNRLKARRVTAAAEKYFAQGMKMQEAINQALTDEGVPGMKSIPDQGPQAPDPVQFNAADFRQRMMGRRGGR